MILAEHIALYLAESINTLETTEEPFCHDRYNLSLSLPEKLKERKESWRENQIRVQVKCFAGRRRVNVTWRTEPEADPIIIPRGPSQAHIMNHDTIQ